MYLNICEKSLTSVSIFCFKENCENVPFFKVLDKETPLRRKCDVNFSCVKDAFSRIKI